MHARNFVLEDDLLDAVLARLGGPTETRKTAAVCLSFACQPTKTHLGVPLRDDPKSFFSFASGEREKSMQRD